MVHRKFFLTAALVCLFTVEGGAAPLISEFMASNSRTLTDGYGNFSDWIEIFNPDDQTVNLGGWHLTDDPAKLNKWKFPDKTLVSGEFLVVFASGKSGRDPRGNLHCSFQLR